MYSRNETRKILVRGVPIGAGSTITVQSMTNTRTSDVGATLNQIRELVSAGCEIVRLAVPNRKAASALSEIRSEVDVPLVADIHFDHRLALSALEAGIDKLRINPGNIGSDEKIREVAAAAAERNVPIRIGVNAGSLKENLLERYGGPTAEALVESALEEVDLLDDIGFHDVCVSMKSSNVPVMINAYRMFAEQRDNPLHVGVTEAGTKHYGAIKSSVGIGAVLSGGIGDTIRVSLTSDPVEEIRAGMNILKALELRKAGPEIVSCPTCGRTDIDIIGLAEEVERRAGSLTQPLVIAVMGCVVNGPGEAKVADYGIAGGKDSGLLFRHGEIVGKVKESELVDRLFSLIEEDGHGEKD
ncbi:flavodoxin-dependent (E)-4-hydroxy-3-methylbut-2-enyl-diphosphate synthase [Candidatus Latescibacterota bacterium]